MGIRLGIYCTDSGLDAAWLTIPSVSPDPTHTFDVWRTAIGENLSFYPLVYVPVDGQSWADGWNNIIKPHIDAAYAKGGKPLIFMCTWRWTSDMTDWSSADPPANWVNTTFTDGDHDDMLDAFAAYFKADGREVWLRFFGEGNGIWVGAAPYCVGFPLGAPVNTPATMKAAYIYLVDRLRVTGECANLKFTWDMGSWPSAAYGGINSTTLASIYPGDAYVDQIGFELYNFEPVAVEHYNCTRNVGIYNEIVALNSARPIYVAESGTVRPTAGEASKIAWIEETYNVDNIAATYPLVTAVMLWDDQRVSPSTGLSFQETPAMKAATVDLLEEYMADIALQETTVLQSHVFRQVHELTKLRALNGWYVKPKSGGAVKQHAAGANMSVDVDAITYYLDGVETAVATLTNVVVTASDATNPRIDVLYVASDGTMTVAPGTPAAVTPGGEGVWQNYETPCTPDMSTTEGVILAEILVPAGATSIVDAYIRMLAVPVSITCGAGTGDVIGPATNTAAAIPAWGLANSKTLVDGYPVVTVLATPGVNTNLPTEKAVRDAIYQVCTTVGTPGIDTQVPSEQAVREALPSIVITVGTPGSDNDVPSEQAVREAIPPKVTTVGDPGSDDNVPSEQAVREALDAISPSGGASFWTVFPGTPVRVGNTSFTNTDAANANYYNLRYGPGTIIKWEKSGGGFQCAKIVSATYSSNEVTYTIVGNTLAADFADMKYCINPCLEAVFIVPGNLPTSALTNVARTIHPAQAIYIFSAQVKYLTAATTTGGVWDINSSGSTIFSTKPPIAATAKVGTETVCNSLLADATTAIAKDSELTLDYDSGHATTPGADAYVYIYWMPLSWRYRS